jgi:hypothetical protein
MEATPDGDSVFFITAEQLLSQDTDTAFDVYDARTCTTTSPCLSPAQPPEEACASTSGCRPATPPQDIPGGPGGTGTFVGPASPIPPRPAQVVAGAKVSKPKPKPLSKAQKLAKALTGCRKAHPHSKKKRRPCELHARKLYGPPSKSKKTAKKSSGRKTTRPLISSRGTR